MHIKAAAESLDMFSTKKYRNCQNANLVDD